MVQVCSNDECLTNKEEGVAAVENKHSFAVAKSMSNCQPTYFSYFPIYQLLSLTHTYINFHNLPMYYQIFFVTAKFHGRKLTNQKISCKQLQSQCSNPQFLLVN